MYDTTLKRSAKTRRLSKQWKCLETIAQKHDQIQMLKTTLLRPKQCKTAQNAARMEGGTIGQAHSLLFLCIFHQQALVINCYRMQRTGGSEERTCTLKQEDRSGTSKVLQMQTWVALKASVHQALSMQLRLCCRHCCTPFPEMCRSVNCPRVSKSIM